MASIEYSLATAAAEAQSEGRTALALRAIERLTVITRADSKLWQEKAELLKALARPSAAAEAFLTAISLNESAVELHCQVALIYGDLEILENSLKYWLRATELAPQDPQPWFEAGRAYGRLGDYELSRRCFANLPAVIDGHWLAVIAELDRERREKAHAVRARLRSRKDGEPSDYDPFLCVRDLADVGRPNAAERLLAAVSDRLNEGQQAALRYRIERRRGGASEALARFREQARRTVIDGEPLFILAEALFRHGEFAQAADALDKQSIERLPPHVQWLRFWALFALGDFESALAWAGEMVQLSPSDTKPYQFVLSSLLSLGRLEPRNGPGSEATDEPAIPSVLLQFWDKPEIPDDVWTVMRTWDDPDGRLRRVLFNDETARAFIQQHFPDSHVSAYDRCHHAAMKSDLFRLCYLSRFGGIYLDVDEACRRSPAALLDSVSDLTLAVPLSMTWPYYTNNNLIAAAPEHPVIEQALVEAVGLITASAASGERPDLWSTTGPGVLTRNVVRYIREGRGGETSRLGLFSASYLDRLAGLNNSLTYKGSAEGNWRLI